MTLRHIPPSRKPDHREVVAWAAWLEQVSQRSDHITISSQFAALLASELRALVEQREAVA